MLLSFSIWYLLIGLLILIYARAAASSPWGPDVKIAVVSGLATIFAFGNYLIGQPPSIASMRICTQANTIFR
ncbi:hypothetical protein AA0113_g5148 [Alternaria arborescens]|uniref:Uncharacterized protein n=1 Tax=Alternaria arborescens TaxID=156630 RepID=A0A4Q4S9W4_9PLEO|nr:hypothetical protein AA0113_g5148 [Alternaria arborescens]